MKELVGMEWCETHDESLDTRANIRLHAVASIAFIAFHLGRTVSTADEGTLPVLRASLVKYYRGFQSDAGMIV